MTTTEPGQAFVRASDVNTPEGELIRLSRHRRRDVRQSVAANPSTPVHTLAMLARTFPHVVAANAVLDWLLLEDANWLSGFDEVSRQRIMAEPGTAESLLWWSARFGSESDRLAVAQNASASPALITYLRADGNVGVSRAASAHVAGGRRPNVDTEIGATAVAGHVSDLVALLTMNLVPTWLIGALDNGDVDVRRAIVAFADTPAHMLLRLAMDDDDRVRAGARAHPRLTLAVGSMLDALNSADPAADLSLVTGPESEDLRSTVWAQMTLATHPATPLDVLTTMVEHQNWRIREAISANQKLPIALLARLAADRDKDVRLAVTRNDVVPAFIIDIMRSDPNQQVRDAAQASYGARSAAGDGDAPPLDGLAMLLELAHYSDDTTALLAGHPLVDVHMLRTLATHVDWRVRLAAVANQNAPVDVVDGGARDVDPDVRQAAVAHHRMSPAVLDALMADPHQEVRIRVARRSTTHETLQALSRDSAVSVREAVAANPNADHSVLRLLAGDVELPVLHALARRPALPTFVADALARHDDVGLKRILLAQPELAPSAVAAVLGGEQRMLMATRWSRLQRGDPRLRSGDVMALVRHAPWAAELLLSPVTFAPVLKFMSRSDNWELRQACARHAETTAEMLAVLATDNDYDVRCAVAAHGATPVEAVEKLAQDDHGAVRLIIAKRADSPPHVLDALTLDDDDDVRNAAMAHPALPTSSLTIHSALSSGTAVNVETLLRLLGTKRAGTTFQRRLVGRYPATPARLLRRLAADDNWRVREDVAMHPNASEKQLARLGSDPDRDVRRAVAMHPHTSADVLVALLSDSDDHVRTAAVVNPALPTEARERHRRSVLNRAARSESSIVQAVAASCEHSSALELSRRRTRQSPHWVVRYALARILLRRLKPCVFSPKMATSWCGRRRPSDTGGSREL